MCCHWLLICCVTLNLQRDNGHEVTYFPSIRDAIDARDWDAAQENVKKVAKKLVAATDKILN